MIDLKIKGMSCQHCVKAVRETLAAVSGVTEVAKVDLESGRASVDGQVEPSALIAAVKEAGYEAEIIKQGAHG